MDIKKGKLNVGVSLAFKIVTMILAICTKTALVGYCGNEVNGLNALYLGIIGFLSVAELGVGSAITFCMYRPIVEGDDEKVSALYMLFRKLYRLIGGIIFVSGLAIMPFLSFLAKDYAEIDVNMYVTFFLVLLSVTLTYQYSSKTSLINAYKNNYITTIISQGGLVLQNVLQILVLHLTHSFYAYLTCRIVSVLLQWSITEFVSRKKYPVVIKGKKASLDTETRNAVKKNIKALFIHKIGYVLVNTVDSVVISAFVGIVSLGLYSNYTMILSSMTGILAMIFTSLTSIIGHLCVEEDRETARKYYESFHLMNFLLATVFFLGYYAVVDSLIALLFSADLVVAKSISFVITLNGFVQFLRKSTLTFKDATGTFYQDRWKPLIEGIINIILSILFVNIVGVTGVILATIVTNLLICYTVEPYVLFKNAFSASPKNMFLTNYGMVLLFALALIVLDRCMLSFANPWAALLVNGTISLGVSAVVCALVLLAKNKQARFLLKVFKRG